ncbi:MAG: class I SAM-dependent methyltransferase [Planctomycetaceae bacterium]|jgi:23S rRNA (cytosine1962-C5)-methyltransferase|nr:class I SAM-dependent methyltransferase [Planctomycetaceae bacterium]
MSRYQLLDFGNARKLEQFGPFLIDRPCPAAEGMTQRQPARWKNADYRFTELPNRTGNVRGHWVPSVPPNWNVAFESFSLQLRGTPFGHLGVFPEQQQNWSRIISVLKQATEPVRVLNLFAYTGGSSLAAAMGGQHIETVHIDSAKNAADWAKENAVMNGVADRIRFITEDARKFVKRENRRGSRYNAVFLDPPSYGHGVRGETWKIADDLPELLMDLKPLLIEPAFFLLTAHTPEWDAVRLQTLVLNAGLAEQNRIEKFTMPVVSEAGGTLPAGCGVRFVV